MKKMTGLLFILLSILPFSLAAQDRGLSLMVKELGPNTSVGKQYLLLIAVDRYQSWTPLRNPVRDARELKEILTSKYYIDETIELYDAAATKANIIKTFTSLKSKLKVNDSLLVYYAGHGHLDKNTNSGFWIPVNAGTDQFEQANWLPNTQIRGLISNLDTIHLLIISDSCFSGDLLNSSRGLQDEINTDYFKKAYARISRQILTSGASESVPDESEFSRMLKLALKKNASPYFDPLMLFGEIRLGVHGTMPMFGSLKDTGHQEGASFLLFLRGAKTAAEKTDEGMPTGRKSSEAAAPLKEAKKTEAAVAKVEKGKGDISASFSGSVFFDDFDGEALEKAWSWVRENKAGWSLKTVKGCLTIDVEIGSINGTANNNRNMLLRETSPGDFTVETKMEFTPSAAYEQAGLIVCTDDDNYVRLVREYGNDGSVVYVGNESRGGFKHVFVRTVSRVTYLRLRRSGDVYSGFYSTDGVNYLPVGEFTNPLGRNPKVGFIANNHGASSNITARFDYFRLAYAESDRAASLAPEKAETMLAAAGNFADEFDSRTLNPRWRWVRENPAGWSLSQKPGYLMIKADTGDLNLRTNDCRNLLLTEVAAENFQIDALVSIEAAKQYQQAGLVIYRDDNNYIKLVNQYDQAQMAMFYLEKETQPRGIMSQNSKSKIYLRLVKKGSTISAFSSDTGRVYQPLGECQLPAWEKISVGCLACNGYTVPVDAYFDFFKLTILK